MINLNQIPNQNGKIILITGANTGLGYETTKFLLKRNATVIMGCRNLLKAEIAKDKLLKETKSGILDVIKIDLSDLEDVKRATELIKNKYNHLDVIINNAGIMAPPKTLSEQGLELQFAVNYLAHMFLTTELLGMLNQKRDSRVVTVTSGVQYFGKILWDNLQFEKNYDRWAAYSQSKLANVMFGLELNSKLLASKSKTSSLLAHPGLARTNLQSNSVQANQSFQDAIAYKIMDPFFQSAQMGSLPQIVAATLPMAKGGQQYGPRFNFRGNPVICRNAKEAMNQTSRKRLWEISKNLISNLISKK